MPETGIFFIYYQKERTMIHNDLKMKELDYILYNEALLNSWIHYFPRIPCFFLLGRGSSICATDGKI